MKLEFAILPGRTSSTPALGYYLSAYATFQSVWQETLAGIHGSSHVLHSNDFTRQDHIQALFAEEGLCIALDCVRAVRLDNPVDLNDSWLRPWPKEILDDLSARCPMAFINSYFTVHPSYRRTQADDTHHVSYVIGCLSVLYQLEVGMPLMLGMMRRDRSMNKLGVSWGAKTLMATNHNGSETDLVVFDLDSVREAARCFPEVVFDLFKRRNDFSLEQNHERP
jgi:hypothetical protein